MERCIRKEACGGQCLGFLFESVVSTEIETKDTIYNGSVHASIIV